MVQVTPAAAASLHSPRPVDGAAIADRTVNLCMSIAMLGKITGYMTSTPSGKRKSDF
jgi:hypothetical protein